MNPSYEDFKKAMGIRELVSNLCDGIRDLEDQKEISESIDYAIQMLQELKLETI